MLSNDVYRVAIVYRKAYRYYISILYHMPFYYQTKMQTVMVQRKQMIEITSFEFNGHRYLICVARRDRILEKRGLKDNRRDWNILLAMTIE